jgi:hypothetical protein
LERYHSFASRRIRNRRRKEAAKYGYDPKSKSERLNFNSGQVFLGLCGNKGCTCCTWQRIENKKPTRALIKSEVSLQSDLDELYNKEYYEQKEREFNWLDYDDQWTQEDEDFLRNYLKAA